ncbi:MAG: TIGR02466 family protein [Pseudomonadota bacterium]
MNHINALFPTPVMVAKGVVNSTAVDRARARAIAHLDQENSHDARLQHSAIMDPGRAPFLPPLAPVIDQQLEEFGVALLGERLKWFLKEVWVNRLGTGGHQATHLHANSLVSGVVYLTPSHPSANLIFERSQGGGQFVFSNFHAGSDVTPYNAARWQIPDIAAGDLVLFPSYLLHGVPRNEGDERISVSFNAIPERLNSWGYSIQMRPMPRE